MSQLIGHAQPVFRLQAKESALVGRPFAMERDLGLTADLPGTFASKWWPRSGFLGALVEDVGLLVGSLFEPPELTSGTNSRLGYQGVTRDAYNSPLGGCTVKCFLTADDSKVTPDIVSDPVTGEFVISTPFYAPHWLKIAKAGAPAVQGVSVDNIYPNV